MVIALAVEGKTIDGDNSPRLKIYSLHRWHSFRYRRKELSWSNPVEREGNEPESFWSMLESLAVGGRTVTVICHHAETCWTLLGGWEAMESGRIHFGDLQTVRSTGEIVDRSKLKRDRCTLVLGRPTTIITHRIGDGRATWLAVGNYVDTSLQSLADSVGITGVQDSAPGVSGNSLPYDARISAQVVGTWFTRLITRWKMGECGPFRYTAAQLGHSLWRSHHLTHDVLVHADTRAAALEHESLFGGRASVWCWSEIGARSSVEDPFAILPKETPYPKVPGPVYHVDVRSMYPSLLRDCAFPTVLHVVRGEVSVAELADILAYRSAIARVSVDHSDGEIPFRGSDHIRYPNGRWTGCYAEPELRMMLDRNEITKVHEVAVYGRSKAFESFARHILDERVRCRLAGDQVGEMMAKLIANGFAGKFAARGGGWQTDSTVYPMVWWGEWIDRKYETGKIERFRSFGGVCQRFVERSNEPSGSPAIFSHLTSLGRCFMRRLRSVCPPKTIFHQDTDGIWCNKSALAALETAGYQFGDEPGKLRIDCESNYLQFLSPKHYCYDGNWVLSGIATGFSPHAHNAFEDLAVQNASSSKMTAPVSWIGVLKRSVTIDRSEIADTITPSGWIVPGKNELDRPDSPLFSHHYSLFS